MLITKTESRDFLGPPLFERITGLFLAAMAMLRRRKVLRLKRDSNLKYHIIISIKIFVYAKLSLIDGFVILQKATLSNV